MPFYQFGGVQIFRPSREVEAAIQERARTHLLSRFSAGEYRGAQAANAVIQHQFQYYEHLLRPLVSKLASRDTAEFLLFQYDNTARILHADGILDLRERERWIAIEPIFRRAIKYLVESMCTESPTAHPAVAREVVFEAMENALVHAESIVELSGQSDLVHSIFSDDCVVRVFDNGPPDHDIRIEGRYAGYYQSFSKQVVRDRESRKRFVGFPQFDNHTATHQRYLDDAFRKSFGHSYGEFIADIVAVIDGCLPPLEPNAFPTLFVHRDKVIDELAKSGRSRTAIERALDGFSAFPANLKAEQRGVWNPKQESRAFRRGFFVFPQ